MLFYADVTKCAAKIQKNPHIRKYNAKKSFTLFLVVLLLCLLCPSVLVCGWYTIRHIFLCGSVVVWKCMCFVFFLKFCLFLKLVDSFCFIIKLQQPIAEIENSKLYHLVEKAGMAKKRRDHRVITTKWSRVRLL